MWRKAYATRVGGGPFPTELEDEIGEQLCETIKGNEFWLAVTGPPASLRLVRCGELASRHVQLNGISGLCITKLDVLDGLDTVRVAVGYKVQGGVACCPSVPKHWPICAPIYEEHAGWKSTLGVKSFEDLPKKR